MPLLPGKQKRGNVLHFITAVILLFTFEIRFIVSETNIELNDGSAVLLHELSGAHLLMAASPVIYTISHFIVKRIRNDVSTKMPLFIGHRTHLGLMNEWTPMEL